MHEVELGAWRSLIVTPTYFLFCYFFVKFSTKNPNCLDCNKTSFSLQRVFRLSFWHCLRHCLDDIEAQWYLGQQGFAKMKRCATSKTLVSV